jgi:hypothetical protein
MAYKFDHTINLPNQKLVYLQRWPEGVFSKRVASLKSQY